MRGDRLKELRERNHYTHEDLASRLDIGYASVYRYEAGKVTPTAEVLARMATLFNVSSDYLLGLSDDPNNNIGDLNDAERSAIAAWRRGDKLQAIEAIVKG